MGAAYLCAIAGIGNEHTDCNTMAYIQSWISRLEEDNRLIVQAAANAQKAIDLIVGTTFEEEITRGDRWDYCANLPVRGRVHRTGEVSMADKDTFSN